MESFSQLFRNIGGIILGVLGSILAGMLTGLLQYAIKALIKSLIDKRLSPQINDLLEEVSKKIKAPKWYNKKASTIDPGLIEVSVAITAATIALPSLISPNNSAGFANLLMYLSFFGEAVSTFTSIYLLDRYAKNKGSKSKHILFDPFSDGPFFLLGWSIVIVFIIISIVVFQVR